MSVERELQPEHVCRAFRFEDGDVLVFQSDERLSRDQVANFNADISRLGERLGVKIHGILLDSGLKLLCAREAHAEHVEGPSIYERNMRGID